MTTNPAPDALRLVPDEMVVAFQDWYLKHTGKRIFARNATKAIQAVLAAAPAVQPAAGREEVPEGMMTLTDDLTDKADELDAMDARGQIWGLEEVPALLRRAAAAISTPAQASETGGEMIGHITQALVRADEEFGNSLSAYRYRKLAEAVAALSAPQAAPGEGEQS